MVEDCYREIAEKIAQDCKNIGLLLSQLVPLSQMNQTAHEALKKSRFHFFMTHYYALPKENTGLFILKKDSITATNVRLGNQMTLEGIELYFNGKFIEAEALFIKAMCTHGSSNAMKILAELSLLPGRIRLNLDPIITLYSAQEKIVIRREYEAAFPTEQHRNCACLLIEPRSTLQRKIECFISAISQIYREHKGISVKELPLLMDKYQKIINDIQNDEMLDDRLQRQLTYIDEINVNGALQEQFDAYGFLGLSAPKEKAWYEKDEREELIKFNF